jgi:hypothetical protein
MLLHKYFVKNALGTRILDDVGEEPGNLPLLEFALTLEAVKKFKISDNK